jgi:hypothetical protein
MRINVNDIKIAPNLFGDFYICTYGKPSEYIIEWMYHWKLKFFTKDSYTNILLTQYHPIEEMFEQPTQYEFVDGFSPNLNKHLHLGHMSNLVLAKAFQNMKIGKKFLAILGDTLSGDVKKNDALDAYQYYCELFKYRVDRAYFASEMKLKDFTALILGEGDYAKTKVFDVSGEKIVGIKSDGSTTYFYQDVSFAQMLNDSTLYLTGLEQENHFNLLKKLCPYTSHIGLGLILFDGKKMSSSEGNVIYLKDLMESMLPKFDNNHNLVYNVIAGNILKSEPKSIKKIDSKTLDQPKQSMGLYVSYTMARMHSAGINLNFSTGYSSPKLKIQSLKAKVNLKPNTLFDGLVEICEQINRLYLEYKIKDSEVNRKMFQTLTHDMILAADELGLLPVRKV